MTSFTFSMSEIIYLVIRALTCGHRGSIYVYYLQNNLAQSQRPRGSKIMNAQPWEHQWELRGQKLSHPKFRRACKESTVVLSKSMASKKQCSSPVRCDWQELMDHCSKGTWMLVHRYLSRWTPLPGATGVAAGVPCSFTPSPMSFFCHFVMSNHCQVANTAPPSTKVSAFRTQAGRNRIMQTRSGLCPLGRQGNS